MATDTFFNGRVNVRQSAKGYRFSLDAVLLAATPRPKPGDRVLDIGTGCGIIPILLAYRHPGIKVIGIELQEGLAKIATKNVSENLMEDRITVLNQDVRSLKIEAVGGTMDWVVSNPPYRSANSGRINPNAERAQARHEIHLNLHDLMQAAKRFLRTGGTFAAIYPSERMVDLLHEIRLAGIEPKWIQSIHSNAADEARLVLIKGRMQGNPGLKVAQPLIIYAADGNYTPAVQKMMTP